MSATTVNISFQADLLQQIDAEARRESRSRSELLREAAREYVKRQRRWKNVFDLGDIISSQRNLTEQEIYEEIADFRQKRSRCR